VSFSDNFSCLITTPNINPSGNYSLCLRDITSGSQNYNYRIRSESQGPVCGFYSNNLYSNFTKIMPFMLNFLSILLLPEKFYLI
jgi:hypothetical protein